MNILPCPFCGSHDVSISHSVDPEGTPASRYIECHKCAAMGPETNPHHGNAVAKWNKRTAAAHAERVAELERQLKRVTDELAELIKDEHDDPSVGIQGWNSLHESVWVARQALSAPPSDNTEKLP